MARREYRVAWKRQDDAEVFVDKDSDYHLLTFEQARDQAEFMKRRNDVFKATNIRLQMREISDWHDV